EPGGQRDQRSVHGRADHAIYPGKVGKQQLTPAEKSASRIAKYETNPHSQIRNGRRWFRIWEFEFVADFGARASDFGNGSTDTGTDAHALAVDGSLTGVCVREVGSGGEKSVQGGGIGRVALWRLSGYGRLLVLLWAWADVCYLG